jgi:hypothetical protein
MMMATILSMLDDSIYYTCCFVVALHSLSAIFVITHGRCSTYAATFLIACAMWIDLTALNLWFFLPTIIQEWPQINFNINPTTGLLWVDALAISKEVLCSASASYFYMMLFGWFVGSMSLSNALSMWQREGCDATSPHTHTGIAGWVVRLAERMEEYVGIYDAEYLPFMAEKAVEEDKQARKSWLFAVPRGLHQYYLLILSPPMRLLVAFGGRIGGRETEWLERDVRGIGMRFDEKLGIKGASDCCKQHFEEIEDLANEKSS